MKYTVRAANAVLINFSILAMVGSFFFFGSLSIVGVGILKIPALNSFYEHFSVI